MGSIHITLAFDFFFADAVGLIPRSLGHTYPPIGETNRGDPLELPPTTSSINPTQPCKVTNSSTNGDRFNLCDVADNLKIHHYSLR
jgi:hypothetical protein